MFRERNSWRNCIKKQITAIVRDLQHQEADSNFMADPNVFMKVMNRRVKVPQLLKDKTEMLYDYVLSFQDENTGKICYREMANDLNTFNFDQETNEGILPRSSGSISSGAYSIAGVQPAKNIFNSDYTVVDSKRVP